MTVRELFRAVNRELKQTIVMVSDKQAHLPYFNRIVFILAVLPYRSGRERGPKGPEVRQHRPAEFSYANTGYRIPVSMEISSLTVSPLRMVTVLGSSRLPPTPW